MIIGLIPARAGSKGVPKKNIKLLGGYPLIAYSIVASKLSSKIDRTIVSTDSQEIADIAIRYGAEVPFLRPPELSTDSSPDIGFVKHTLEWLQYNGEDVPEYLVLLRPTVPLRDPSIIDQATWMIENSKEATSLRSAHIAERPPAKFFWIEGCGWFASVFSDDPRLEYHILPRQTFPTAYDPNGYVDAIKAWTIEDTGTLYGSRILPFITDNVGEVDAPEDFEYIEWRLQKYGSILYDYLKEVSN